MYTACTFLPGSLFSLGSRDRDARHHHVNCFILRRLAREYEKEAL